MYGQRVRSPLRLLSATMSALMVIGLAAIAGPWLILLAPVVAGLFLLAPPIGIYRHDETPVPRTDVTLDAFPVETGMTATLGFLLTLVNDGTVPAHDVRLRLLVPHKLVPAQAAPRLLGPIHAGTLGRNWFVDATGDATAVTFRAGHSGAGDEILCPPQGRLELAVLNLPAQAHPLDVTLEYQVSGGSASPAINRLRLRSTTP